MTNAIFDPVFVKEKKILLKRAWLPRREVLR